MNPGTLTQNRILDTLQGDCSSSAKGTNMLETCGKVMLDRLAKAKGKVVNHIDLSGIPSFSLIQVTTETDNVYLIETREAHGESRVPVLIVQMKMYLVVVAQIKESLLLIDHVFEYSDEGREHTSSPIKEIHLLAT